MLFSFPSNCVNICQLLLSNMMPNRIAWDILLVLITVAGNLCNKCPKWLLEQNSSYSDHFNVISGLYRTAEPQEALWQYSMNHLEAMSLSLLLQYIYEPLGMVPAWKQLNQHNIAILWQNLDQHKISQQMTIFAGNHCPRPIHRQLRFSETQKNFQYWHYCRLYMPTYLQFSSLFSPCDINKCV